MRWISDPNPDPEDGDTRIVTKCGRREFDVEMVVRLRVKCTDDRVETTIPGTVEELVEIMDAGDAICNEDYGGCGTVFDTTTGEIVGFERKSGVDPSNTDYSGEVEEGAVEVEVDELQARADEAWRNLLCPDGTEEGEGEEQQ